VDAAGSTKERAARSIGYRVMSDKFTDALLTALNESTEVQESDWNSIAAVLRGPIAAADDRPQVTIHPPASENRYAATVSSCMAKIRAGR
jgi:hypothetical protein